MARFLQQLLEIDEPTFSVGIRQLEHLTGLKGVDTRLIADITHRSHDILRKLGLSPSESRGEEVYRALINSVRRGVAEALLFKADYVMMPFDGEIISFNLIDIIESYHFELPFSERIVSHGRRSLRGEMVHRYIDSAGANEEIARHLASEVGLLTEADAEYLDAPDTKVASNHPYILSIGDIVTDAFIDLDEKQAKIETDNDGKRWLSMEYGTKLPYQDVEVIEAVGNSANAAVAFSRLGLNAGLMAFLGDDQAGRNCRLYLESEKVDIDLVSIQTGQKTNYHYVLRYGADRTILVKYQNYDYSWQEPKRQPDWIYLSMLSDASWDLHESLIGYLEQHQDVKLAFQPGVFHFEWGKDRLKPIYKRAEVVIMNREEAAKVTGIQTKSIDQLAKAVHDLGTKIVAITDGPDGAYVSDGKKVIQVPNYPDPSPPLDRTGAGDAFASTLVAALALGNELSDAVLWAPINAMNVVQKLGAQQGLLTASDIKTYLLSAPQDYAVKEYKE